MKYITMILTAMLMAVLISGCTDTRAQTDMMNTASQAMAQQSSANIATLNEAKSALEEAGRIKDAASADIISNNAQVAAMEGATAQTEALVGLAGQAIQAVENERKASQRFLLWGLAIIVAGALAGLFIFLRITSAREPLLYGQPRPQYTALPMPQPQRPALPAPASVDADYGQLLMDEFKKYAQDNGLEWRVSGNRVLFLNDETGEVVTKSKPQAFLTDSRASMDTA